MGGINWKRVILGGLVAGLISLVSGYILGHVVLAGEVEALLKRLNVEPTLRIFLQVLAIRLALGIALVWLYAAIRPRFGPGPRTAAITGTAAWLLVWGFYAGTIEPLGLYSTRALLLGLVWDFFEMQAMALAGGWLYREP